MNMQEIIRLKLSQTGLKGTRKVTRQRFQWKVPCEEPGFKMMSGLFQEKLYGISVSFRHYGVFLYIIYSPNKTD